MTSEISLLIQRVNDGDPAAGDELMERVYAELKRIAQKEVSSERPDNSLNATALVNEAWLRICSNDTNVQWNSRGHFFTAAAIAMRRILIDRARKRNAAKRGRGIRPVPLEDIDPAAEGVSTSPDGQIDILELDRALQILEAESPDLSKLVNLRFFAGLTVEQAAESLGISVRTANRNWSYARARLFQLIDSAPG